MVQQESAKIDGDMELLRDTIADLKAAANDPGLQQAEAERIAGVMAVASNQMAMATAAKAKADKAIADVQAAISRVKMDQADIGTELQVIGGVIQSTGAAVPPPYGVYLGIFGTLVGAVGTGIAKRKGDALAGVVKSVDVAKKTLGPSDKNAFVEAMKDSQKDLGVNREAIRKIRA